MPLKRYNAGVSDTQGVVSAFGTVSKDGVEYYRLKTNNDPNFTYWYCVPKLDENTHTPNLLVMPTTTQPIGKVTVARDTLHLAKSRLETDLPKFLDDMVPKFLRNKNTKIIRSSNYARLRSHNTKLRNRPLAGHFGTW
jgi:hypothetical protein